MERSYEQVLEALAGALKFGIHPSLAGIRALTEALGSPERSFRAVQVTGTNGKSSVTRMTAALLRAHGIRAGAYTSPHLVRYEERIELDGRSVARTVFAAGISAALDAAERLGAAASEALGVADTDRGAFTEFELITAGALEVFRRSGVDVAVLEVGMGGRWDATSVVAPEVSVITGVALDHTDRLGATREEIAADKAHVIKPGSIAVLGPGCAGVEHIFLDRAAGCGAPVVRVGQGEDDVAWLIRSAPRAVGEPLVVDVFGSERIYHGINVVAPSYQAPNLATAVAAAEAAVGGPLDEGAVCEALRRMRFPGRFDVLDPAVPVVADGAHNPEAAGVLAEAVHDLMPEPPVVVLGVMADKDAAGIARALAPVARGFVCTRSRSPRALPAETLAEIVRIEGGHVAGVETGVASAVALAVASGTPVLCTGSLFVAGEAIEIYRPSTER